MFLSSRVLLMCGPRKALSRMGASPSTSIPRSSFPAKESGASSTMVEASTSVTTPSQAVDFLTLLQQLKVTKRTGWVRRNINGPESIADHMYRMGLMALIAGDASVDKTRCIKLALVHDVAEAIVGDIAPDQGISKEDKFRLENEAMQQIKRILGGSSQAGTEVEALWQEYEEGSSKEAQLVKDFDKLEMILQAQEYEQDQNVNLQEFFDSTEGKFKTELGKAWAAEIRSRREPAGGLG